MGELTKYIAKRDYECKIIRNLITTIRSRSGYLAELKYRFYKIVRLLVNIGNVVHYRGMVQLHALD
jgi:hypothetical protein